MMEFEGIYRPIVISDVIVSGDSLSAQLDAACQVSYTLSRYDLTYIVRFSRGSDVYMCWYDGQNQNKTHRARRSQGGRSWEDVPRDMNRWGRLILEG